MEEIILIAKVDEDTTIYVSPMHDYTYSEFVENDNLGGSAGYFIARQHQNEFQILGKATDLHSAREIFSLMVSASKAVH